MKFYQLTLLLFFSFQIPKLQAGPSNTKSNDPVKVVMEKLNCSKEQAEDFLVYVSKQMDIIRIALSEISSTNTHPKDKQKLIDLLLKNIVDKDAVVIVSTVVTDEILSEFTMEEYLYYLSNLSEKYDYDAVDLFFDPEFLNLSGIEYKNKNKGIHELLIDVKQYFRGSSTKRTYKDLTFKTFKCNVYESKEGAYELKLQSIRVKETLNVTMEELIAVKKDFEQLKKEYLKSKR